MVEGSSEGTFGPAELTPDSGDDLERQSPSAPWFIVIVIVFRQVCNLFLLPSVRWFDEKSTATTELFGV